MDLESDLVFGSHPHSILPFSTSPPLDQSSSFIYLSIPFKKLKVTIYSLCSATAKVACDQTIEHPVKMAASLLSNRLQNLLIWELIGTTTALSREFCYFQNCFNAVLEHTWKEIDFPTNQNPQGKKKKQLSRCSKNCQEKLKFPLDLSIFKKEYPHC